LYFEKVFVINYKFAQAPLICLSVFIKINVKLSGINIKQYNDALNQTELN